MEKEDSIQADAGAPALSEKFNSALEQAMTLCMCGQSHSQRTCEHEWGGWREIDGGRGGERFCQKCGLGAMAHSLSLDW
jgi:hypothetical protein